MEEWEVGLLLGVQVQKGDQVNESVFDLSSPLSNFAGNYDDLKWSILFVFRVTDLVYSLPCSHPRTLLYEFVSSVSDDTTRCWFLL
jgi:hypothetical protein